MRKMTLGTRTFLLTFVPVLVLLLSTFVAISAAIRERVKLDLADSLRNTDRLLNDVNEANSRENADLLAKLTDSAGLRASVSLLSEAKMDSSVDGQIHETISQQLKEFAAGSPYHYLAILDRHGAPIATLYESGGPFRELSAKPLREGLSDLDGVLFQTESVPIEIAGETAAFLSIGRPFDLQQVALGGQAALLRGHHIAYSTFPKLINAPLESALLACPKLDNGCEVKALGQIYVVSTLHRQSIGNDYQLLAFRSLDEPLRAFNHALLPTILKFTAGGIVFALLCTALVTRSVVRPLSVLASQLELGADSGELPDSLDAGGSVAEVEVVSAAFNRVAAAERRSKSDLTVAKQAAEVANRLKSEFLNNISHELRTPVNGVLGMAELLQSTQLDEEQSEYGKAIIDSAGSLISLIDQILDFSELETARLRLRENTLDILSIVEDIRLSTQARIGQRQIAVESNLISLPSSTCLGDDKRIRQALLCLCDNALKFTASGHIRITLDTPVLPESMAALRFHVEDTGIGIADSDLDYIFQAFTQVDGSLTRRQGGTGIGLSVTRRLVELMGGQVGVTSKVGSGSHFWFTVPVRLVQHSPHYAPNEAALAL